ncbi:hypothetical protein [Fusobacterium mortiferum]|uniref:hypothetical protein n=1 Tax=Fusobacterium mortiferum TaxID=850 RepID=UPI003F92D41D
MNNMNSSEQLYDSALLLGALLQITGLSISELQLIIQGQLLLDNSPKIIRAHILEKSSFRSTLCAKCFENNIDFSDLNEVFNSNYEISIIQQNLYNIQFHFNNYNFSLKQNFGIRRKLIQKLKTKYHFPNKKIADILDIAPATITKEIKSIKDSLEK